LELYNKDVIFLNQNKIHDLYDFQKESEKLQDELLGLEHEDGENIDDESLGIVKEQPFDADKIRIDQKVLALTYLLGLINDKKLNLMPDFQRNKVWDDKRKSLLIESLMLRIPIPAFYFYEDSEGKKYVIDGLQRLSTIDDFMKGHFTLIDLQYLGEQYNGCNIKQIKPKHRTRIDETQFTINIIDARNPPQVKYDIFRRVNTGGMPLKPQEIRNIIAEPKTRTILKKMVTSEDYLKATRGRINDLRMDGQELVLKFLLFYRCYNKEKKRPIFNNNNLINLLDNEIEVINQKSDKELQAYYNVFNKAMKKVYALFGKTAFSKPGYSNIINKALFISWSVVMATSEYDLEYLNSKRNIAQRAFKKRIDDDYYYSSSLTSSTNSSNNIRRQFEGVYAILGEITSD